MKKPTKLGSMSPSHKEPCKDIEPFISRSPETPPLEADKDDYRDDKCPGKTCLEEAEELERAAAESGGRQSGGRGSATAGTPSGRSSLLRSPAKSSRSPATTTGSAIYYCFNHKLNFCQETAGGAATQFLLVCLHVD